MEKRIIEAGSKSLSAYFRDISKHRALIFTFAYRDIKVQYAQTFLGVLWSVIQPVTALLIFTFFFGKIIKVNTGGIPYPLFALSGISVWSYFSFLMGNAGTSLIQSRDLIKKISFPKIIIPLSKVFSGASDFLITLLLMFVVMIFDRKVPGIEIIALPFFILIALFCGLAAGLWLSTLTVRYRDVHHIIPFLVSFGIWLTPVFYPTTMLPNKYHPFIYLNPMAGVIEGFRWSLFGGQPPSLYYAGSFIFVFILTVGGIINFKKMENRISDWI